MRHLSHELTLWLSGQNPQLLSWGRAHIQRRASLTHQGHEDPELGALWWTKYFETLEKKKNSQKQMKESFVSDHNGTSMLEIIEGLGLPTLLILCRGLGIIFSQHLSFSSHTWRPWFFIDFAFLIVPLVTILTTFSTFVLLEHLVIIFGAELFYKIYCKKIWYVRMLVWKILEKFLKVSLDSEYIPGISCFHVIDSAFTAVAILAIDFPCFPRRLPKIGVYGIGAMDFQIGRFLLRTAMISPKIRRKHTKGPDFILWSHCTLAISLPRNGMINYYKICRISVTFNWVWSSMEHFLYLNSCEIYSITALDYFSPK